jgi:hypothetical protein
MYYSPHQVADSLRETLRFIERDAERFDDPALVELRNILLLRIAELDVEKEPGLLN